MADIKYFNLGSAFIIQVCFWKPQDEKKIETLKQVAVEQEVVAQNPSMYGGRQCVFRDLQRDHVLSEQG
jgi:hypothetical protein